MVSVFRPQTAECAGGLHGGDSHGIADRRESHLPGRRGALAGLQASGGRQAPLAARAGWRDAFVCGAVERAFSPRSSSAWRHRCHAPLRDISRMDRFHEDPQETVFIAHEGCGNKVLDLCNVAKRVQPLASVGSEREKRVDKGDFVNAFKGR
jgi:hypothetical protein